MRHGTEYEVVHVTRPFRLLDAERYERTYRRADGAPLARGYYVVSWSNGARRGSFDTCAEFDGPFSTRAAASRHLDHVAAPSCAAPLKA